MKNILITDDSMVIRMRLNKLLKEKGYHVVGEAVDGIEAVKKYKKLEPDLITLDISMPKQNGLEALQEILKYNDKAKVIVISAIAQKGMAIKALTIGASDFILKPFEEEVLTQKIKKIIESV